jgi:hypothetical protein
MIYKSGINSMHITKASMPEETEDIEHRYNVRRPCLHQSFVTNF